MLQTKFFTRAVAPRSSVNVARRGFAQPSSQFNQGQQWNKEEQKQNLSKKIEDVVDQAEEKTADFATKIDTSLNEGWEQAKSGVKKATKFVQENEAPLASNLKQTAQTVKETIKDTAKAGAEKIGINSNESATEMASDVASKVYNVASSAASTVASMAKGTAEKLGFSSTSTTENIKDAANSGMEAAKEAGQKAASNIKETASNIKETASEAANQAKKAFNSDTVKNTMENVKENITGTLKSATQKGAQTLENAAETVKDTFTNAKKATGEMVTDFEKEEAHKLANKILDDASTIQKKRQEAMKISTKGAQEVDSIMGNKMSMEKGKDMGIDETGIPKTMDLNLGEIDVGDMGKNNDMANKPGIRTSTESGINRETEDIVNKSKNIDSGVPHIDYSNIRF